MSKYLLVKEYVGAGLLNRGDHFQACFEIEPLEVAGPFTKVKVLDINGVDKYRKKTLKEEVDGSWVPTNQLITINDPTTITNKED